MPSTNPTEEQIKHYITNVLNPAVTSSEFSRLVLIDISSFGRTFDGFRSLILAGKRYFSNYRENVLSAPVYLNLVDSKTIEYGVPKAARTVESLGMIIVPGERFLVDLGHGRYIRLCLEFLSKDWLQHPQKAQEALQSTPQVRKMIDFLSPRGNGGDYSLDPLGQTRALEDISKDSDNARTTENDPDARRAGINYLPNRPFIDPTAQESSIPKGAPKARPPRH